MAQMAGAMPRRQKLANLLIESEQPYCVALKVEKISNGCGECGGVLTFVIAERTEPHRTTVVADEVTAKIGFILELFDEVTIASGENAPIEIAWVVARRVLAVFGKLD